jgi:hypothetical protein
LAIEAFSAAGFTAFEAAAAEVFAAGLTVFGAAFPNVLLSLPAAAAFGEMAFAGFFAAADFDDDFTVFAFVAIALFPWPAA